MLDKAGLTKRIDMLKESLLAWAGVSKGKYDIIMYLPEFQALCRQLDKIAPGEGERRLFEYLQERQAKKNKRSEVTNEFIDQGDHTVIKVVKPARNSAPERIAYIKVDPEDAEGLRELVDDFNAVISFRTQFGNKHSPFVKYNGQNISLPKFILNTPPNFSFCYLNGDSTDVRKANIGSRNLKGTGAIRSRIKPILKPVVNADLFEEDFWDAEAFGDGDFQDRDFDNTYNVYDLGEIEEMESGYFEALDEY